MIQRPLIPVVVSFAGGIVLCHGLISRLPSFIILSFILIASLLIVSLIIPPRWRYPAFLPLFLLSGALFDLSAHRDSTLLLLADQRAAVKIEGTVLVPPRVLQDSARYEVRAHRIFVNGKVEFPEETVLVRVYSHATIHSPGEKILFPARLNTFNNFNNPGGYDYEMAMRLRGLSCAASVSDGRYIIPLGEGHLGFPRNILEKTRRQIRNFFHQRLSSENSALYDALILGETEGIDPELRELFNITGLGHVLAVSGLNIGIVAWLSFFLLKRILSLSYYLTLRFDIQKAAAILTCIPVIAYTCLANFQVSIQRAMIMTLVYLFSLIFGREKEVWSTLSLSALIILAMDPHAIHSLSFQLSFGAVIGILWLAPPIYKSIPLPFDETKEKTLLHHLYSYFAGVIVITLSATIFLLAVTVFYFNRISLISLVANLATVPVFGLWCVPLGLLSAAILPISHDVAGLFLQAGAWGIEAMMAVIRFWAGFDWAASWIVTPNLFEVILFHALLFFIFFLRGRPWARIGLLFTAIMICTDISYWVYKARFNPELKVTYFDVGQGNAALIQFPGRERMLIDGGGFPRDTFDLGRFVVAPALWHSKIGRIDYLVLTHPQADHMNGLRFIAANFGPKEFWCNGDSAEGLSYLNLMSTLESKKIRRLLPIDLAGGREIGGVRIELLHPLDRNDGAGTRKRSRDPNDNSLVLRFSSGGKSLLFPGDLPEAGERRVLQSAGPALRSDVLLAGHHGSKTSCSRPFLEMVRPRICVISSGRGNSAGFPHRSTLERLKDIGCRVIRIDQSGAVTISLGKEKFEIKTYAPLPRSG